MLADKLEEKYGTTMNPSQVAEVLQQHPTHIRSLCASGELPAVRIGGRWHIPTAQFAAMFECVNR